jgi:hypothetical protein
VYLNLQSSQMFITASNRNKNLLDPLIEYYNGNVSVSKENGVMQFKWMINKKEDILYFINDYIKENPLRSSKMHRIYLIPLYYD